MHPRNRFSREKPDFSEVFGDKEGGSWDWVGEDTTALRKLTGALLHKYVAIEHWSLPAGINDKQHLCPPVPRSLNYIHWIEDLLLERNSKIDREIRGLDIGTGASCIFPLLACALHKRWKFVATDVDIHSIAWAQTLVDKNGLQDRIQLLHTLPSGSTIIEQQVTFTMCNPPFFESEQAADKTRKGLGAFQGTSGERWGSGEVKFVKSMIQDSIKFSHRDNVEWFTSMLGRKASLEQIIEVLSGMKDMSGLIQAIRYTTLRQGHTFRWAIAWSFRRDPSSTFSSSITRRNLVFAANRTVFSFRPTATLETIQIWDRIHESLSEQRQLQHCIPEIAKDGNKNTFIVRNRDGEIGFLCMIFVRSEVEIHLLDECSADRKAFRQFAIRIQQDVERTNRRWRRKRTRSLERSENNLLQVEEEPKQKQARHFEN